MNPLSLLSQHGRRYRCCFYFKYNAITTTTTTTTTNTKMTNIRTFRDYRYDWDTTTTPTTTTTDKTKILLLSSHQQRSPLPQLYDVNPSLPQQQQQPQQRYFTSTSSSSTFNTTTTRHTSSSSSFSSSTTTTTPPTTKVPIVTITKNTLMEESNHNNNINNSVITTPPHPLVGEERKNAIQTLNETSSNGSPFQWEDDPTGRNAIIKIYHFLDFQQAFDFMTHVATIAEQMNHHPEWKNIYNIVEVTLSTHDCHGVSYLDIQLAQKMDEYANQLLPQRTSSSNTNQ